MTMVVCCYSVGRAGRQQSTLQSRRNPISKPIRRQSGKVSACSSKVSQHRHDTLAAPGAEIHSDTPTKSDSKTEQSKSNKVESSIGERLGDLDIDAVDVHGLGMFHCPLAERVKLRRMSQNGDINTDDSELNSVQPVAGKVPSAKTKLLKSTASSKKNSVNNKTSVTKSLRAVKSALKKKKLAVCSAVKLSGTKPTSTLKSVQSVSRRSVQISQSGNSVALTMADNSKQQNKQPAVQKLKPKTISKSDSVAARSLNEKSVTANAVQAKRSSSVKDLVSRKAEAAEKMPRLKVNSVQDVTVSREKSMPVLKQETSVAKTSPSAKRSPRKRQQPSPTTKSKSPKLSPTEESSHIVERRSLRNSDAVAETLFHDDDMPQLSAVELMEKAEPLTVVVDQFDSPPELHRSPLCDREGSMDQKKKKSPTWCLHDNKDAALKTSPRSVKSATKEHISAQTHSPARSKHHGDSTPVSTCTELSQSNCSIESSMAVTQAVCSVSSQHSKAVAVMQSGGSEPYPVAVTQSSFCMSSQDGTALLKQASSDISSTAEDRLVCISDSTEPSGEMVPYTPPANSFGGQWQLPCAVPMAPFIITGMYPMMGSGYGCQMMSFPPLVTPGMPAATAVISGHGSNLQSSPLQYSAYHRLPMSAASRVVPLYMPPVVSPFVQPGPSSSHVNLMPFMPPAAAVHNQPSPTTLVLRPSYAVSYVLPAQQQQVKLTV